MNAAIRKEEPYNQIFFKIILLLLAFGSVSLYNYLLFHTLVELFCVILAFNIFLIGWNHRNIIANNFIYFISIAYLFIGILDTFHTITYQGMNIIQNSSFKATELWISSRYMESISILIAFILMFIKKNMKNFWVIFIYTIVTVTLLTSILLINTFPVCYIPGKGLTTFKITSEYIICCIYFVNILLLILFRRKFTGKTFILLLISFIAMICAELSFTFYISVYGTSILVGDLFKVIAVYFYYKAIVITGIFTPYTELIDKTLEQNNELKDSNNKLIAREIALNKTDKMLKILVEKLKFAKSEADKSNAAKSKFLANMSHELRTPLNSIIGFSQVLNEQMFGNLNEKQKEYSNYILSSGNHLLSLINDILDIAKTDSGKLKLFISKINLRELIDNSLSMVKQTCEEHSIRVDTTFEDGLPIINGDERKLKQVLYNILSNAVKFTPDKGNIIVECMSRDNSVFISVKDSGIGIDPENNQQVFSEFEQIEPSFGTEYKGTGLGMPLSKRLVELHGGKIWFESEGKGKGTTFFVILPILKGCKYIANCDFFGDSKTSESELYKTIKDNFCKGNFWDCARYNALEICGVSNVPKDLTPYGEARAEFIIKNYKKEENKSRFKSLLGDDINEKLIWSDVYSVGVEEIDEQHKELLNVADNLYNLINENKIDNGEVNFLLQKLKNYTDVHFKTEEEFFLKIKYPDLEKHKEEHVKFEKSIKEFIDKFINKEINEFELLSFLLEWIINHICYEDMKYKDYLNSKEGKTIY